MSAGRRAPHRALLWGAALLLGCGGPGREAGQPCGLDNPGQCASGLCLGLAPACADGGPGAVCAGSDCSARACPAGQACRSAPSGQRLCVPGASLACR